MRRLIVPSHVVPFVASKGWKWRNTTMDVDSGYNGKGF